MSRNGKLKLGVYWASSCGGCDISLLEIGDHVLELVEAADIAFWPCVADFKYADVAAYPDGYLDLCLFNGGVRNSEQEGVARLLRKKSRLLVAYGACAMDGGIPALANLCGARAILDTVYHDDNPTLENPDGIEPQPKTVTARGVVSIPSFYPAVLRLADIVGVDAVIPGCPPNADFVWRTIAAILAGQPLPPLGAKTVCDECKREKRQVRIAEFHRAHEYRPQDGWCLLEQGILCMGPATRSGCDAPCPRAGVRCEGCAGAAAASVDQGAAMMGAIGTLLDASTEERARELVDQMADPAGTFYRFTLASGRMKGALRGEVPA